MELARDKSTAPSALSPWARVRLDRRPPPGTLAEEIALLAEYPADPDSPHDLCPAAHRVVPATWQITLPGGRVVKVGNSDPADRQKLVKSGGFITCEGRFTLTGPVRYAGTY